MCAHAYTTHVLKFLSSFLKSYVLKKHGIELQLTSIQS